MKGLFGRGQSVNHALKMLPDAFFFRLPPPPNLSLLSACDLTPLGQLVMVTGDDVDGEKLGYQWLGDAVHFAGLPCRSSQPCRRQTLTMTRAVASRALSDEEARYGKQWPTVSLKTRTVHAN